MIVILDDFKYKGRHFKQYKCEIPDVTIIGAFADEAIVKLVAKSLDEFIEQSTIRININAEQCPYWDYKKHTAKHTCDSCTCMASGNNTVSITHGIKLGHDRYCLMDSDVKAEIRRREIENEE